MFNINSAFYPEASSLALIFYDKTKEAERTRQLVEQPEASSLALVFYDKTKEAKRTRQLVEQIAPTAMIKIKDYINNFYSEKNNQKYPLKVLIKNSSLSFLYLRKNINFLNDDELKRPSR